MWLAFEGEWKLILVGFALSFIMPTLWTIVSVPTIALSGLFVKLAEDRNKVGATFVGLLLGLINSFLIMAWTIFVFVYFKSRISVGTYIPVLLWGYSTATSPLIIYMASKEPPDNIGSIISVFMSEIGYILLVVLVDFSNSNSTS